MSKDLSFVIPAAGIPIGMKSFGPKSLLEFNGQKLIQKQISEIHYIYPKSDIVVVLGFEINKITMNLPDFVKVVENENYETTGVSRSIAMGLRVCSSKRAVVIYGDTLFDANHIKSIPKTNFIIYGKNNNNFDKDVGLLIDKNKILNIDYGFSTKWRQIFGLNKNEIDYFKFHGNKPNKKTYLGHEILKELINYDHVFQPVLNTGIKKINCKRDFNE